MTYFNELRAVIDRHAPLRERRVTDRPSAPWMCEEVKSAKADKRRAERRWRKTRLPEDKLVFKSLLYKLNDIISKSKKLYFESKINASSTSKSLFDIVSTMYGKGKNCVLPKNITFDKIPEVFNNYFVDKIAKIRSLLDSTILPTTTRNCVPSCNSCTITEFELVSPSHVKNVILSSAPKCCSLDPIPTAILFKHIDLLINCITSIVNDSIGSGVVPHCFKKAIITPLIKKLNLDPNELKNYRPVSNLSYISKITEKIVSLQIIQYLKNNSLFEKHQSAYRQLHNTETALIKITNDLLLSADDKKVSVLVLLDLSAAFDTIDHTILLSRLQKTFGFGGTVLNWFKSYLSNRVQCVKINNISSCDTPLLFGVPQGSVLGPLLYTLYTAPLGVIIRKHGLKYHFYADDSQLYLCIEPDNLHDLIFKVEICIAEINEWMLVNKLKANNDKTEAVLINPKNFEINCNGLVIGNENVTFANSATNLGVTIDSDLSMSSHISNLSRSVYLEIRRIKQISKFVNENCLKTLAASFILSRLDYCNALFKNIQGYQIEKLQKLQNFAAKVVLKKSLYDHVTPCLMELHWLPIKYRIDFKIAVTTFKCLNDLAPSYLSELIEIYTPSRSLRSSSLNLLKPKVTHFKTLGDKSFSFTAPLVWNKLPLYLRNEKSINIFKKNLKTFYFTEAFLV